MLGAPLSARAVVALWERTRGNPLAIVEYLRAARQAGGCKLRHDRWELSGAGVDDPRLAHLVERRFSGSTLEEREAVELLAVGGPLPLAQLEKLCSVATLGRLETRGLIHVEKSRQRSVVALSRGLDAEILQHKLPQVRQREHLRRLSEAAQAFPSHRCSDAMATVAWQLASGVAVDHELALAAGREALRCSDPVLALQLAAAAAAVDEDYGSALLHGEALAARGQLPAASAGFERAVSLATSEPERAWAAALHARLWFFAGGDMQRGIDLVDAALSSCAQPDATEELEMLRALFASFTGPLDQGMVARLRATIRSDTEPRTAVAVLAISSIAAVVRGGFSDAERQLATARELEPGVRAFLPYVRAQLLGTEAMMQTYRGGSVAGGLGLLSEALDSAGEYRDPAARGYLGAVLTHLSAVSGRIEFSERAGRDALDWLDQVDPIGMTGTTLAHLAYASAVAGDLDGAETWLKRLADRGLTGDVRAALGVTLARLRLAAARATPGVLELAGEQAARLASSHPIWSALIAHEVFRLDMHDLALASLLDDLAKRIEGELVPLFAEHGRAVVGSDAAALERVSGRAELSRVFH